MASLSGWGLALAIALVSRWGFARLWHVPNAGAISEGNFSKNEASQP